MSENRMISFMLYLFLKDKSKLKFRLNFLTCSSVPLGNNVSDAFKCIVRDKRLIIPNKWFETSSSFVVEGWNEFSLHMYEIENKLEEL